MNKQRKKINAPGFTILFAAIVASLLLAVGLTIFDITFKQAAFSSIVRNSSYAIYAADAGYECAQYWDSHATGNEQVSNSGSSFATSSGSLSSLPTGSVICDGQDITQSPPPQIPWGEDPAPDTDPSYCQNGHWCVYAAGQAATTTFELKLPQGNCAIVQVAKSGPIASESISYISRGYNTCDLNDPTRVERLLETF
jgi:hypothetical protein